MFKQEQQVLRTYTTWRWMWLILPLTLLMMLGAAYSSSISNNTPESILIPAIFGIGMPICTGLQWFVAIAKWQFANPRARLIPSYAGPHLLLVATVLATLLVFNPLLQSLCIGISPLGPLAYALMTGSLFLYAIHSNSGIHGLPAFVVFLSGMYPPTSRFWFSDSGYGAIHLVLAAAGLAMVIAWLWRLATLTEEMDDYRVMPLGSPGSFSRLERYMLRQVQGRRAARSRWGGWLSDRWHDRLTQRPMNRAKLAEYGWRKIPNVLPAFLLGLGFATYGIFLSQLANYNDKPFPLLTTVSMIAIAAIVAPAIGAGISLRKRRSRLFQELLRPASREEYIDGLLKSLAKQTAWTWLSLSCAVLVTVLLAGLPLKYNPTRLIYGYLLWVPSFQLLLFAVAIYGARWRSSIACFIILYAISGASTALFVAWADSTTLSESYAISTLMGILFAIVGLLLMPVARRAWLQTELG